MSVKETPLARVKRLHGSKEKLVDAVVDLLAKESSDESPGELKVRLMAVSNKKLLRLHDSLVEIKDEYGSKEELVRALSEAQGKARDADYVNKLQTQSIYRLLDLMKATSSPRQTPS